jgi:alanine racemase
VFAAARADLAAHGHDSDAADVEVHAANSAGALAFVAAHFDFVRPGIALYGIAPSAAVPALMLEPALALKAQVSYVQDLRAGDAISYGLRYRLDRSGRVATVPVGYADGVPRALGEHGGQALVHGVRVPIAGTITMDQLMLDVGDVPVVAGDEVVLLGRQGDAAIDAAEWAQRIGTIPYEIVTGIGPRVPRHYVNGDGDEGADAMTATGEVERGHGA